MGEFTKIEWTDHTFNPWEGCTKVSPACDFCYAERMVTRFKKVKWGNYPRRRTSVAYWKNPLRWERAAEKFYAEHGRRQRVFCASLADVFDNQVPSQWRADLWELIRKTPSIDWLLLTKRPQNIEKMKPDFWDDIKGGVWLGATAENQENYDRAHKYLSQQDSAIIFVSIEPMLGAIDTYRGGFDTLRPMKSPSGQIYRAIDWIIAGGESGPNARPSNPNWFLSLRDQCAAAGIPFLFKQWGEWHPWNFPLLDGSINLISFGKKPSKFYDEFQGHILSRVGKARAGRYFSNLVVHDGFPNG